MIIYGVALLSFCFLAGKAMGLLLGRLMGIGGDVGGVGFAMILLLFVHNYSKNKGWLTSQTTQGITFWSFMYLPIIVAMASTLHVRAALSGGIAAVLAGCATAAAAFMLVPLLVKMVQKP